MRRLPLIVSFLLFIALCASAAYWAMQLFKPPLRPVAAPPRAAQAEIRPEAAASLFGNRRANVAAASNYQLRGVIFSGSPKSSVAIISADGKPAQAIRVDTEVAPGVTIKEVHRDHVLLSEGGATKRVELPESAKGLEPIAAAPAATRPTTSPPTAVPPTPTPGQPIPTRAQAAAAAQAAQSGQQSQTATPQVPPVPTGQQPQRPVTPQNAPTSTQAAPAVPPAAPLATQPISPTTTTAPPTTVVSPPAAVPGTITMPQAQPPAAAPVTPNRQSLPGVPPGPMR